MANDEPTVDENSLLEQLLRYMADGSGLDELVETIRATKDGPDKQGVSTDFAMSVDGPLGSPIHQERLEILAGRLGNHPFGPT